MAEKIVPKKDGKEPSQLELDVANGILNFQVSEWIKIDLHACLQWLSAVQVIFLSPSPVFVAFFVVVCYLC